VVAAAGLMTAVVAVEEVAVLVPAVPGAVGSMDATDGIRGCCGGIVIVLPPLFPVLEALWLDDDDDVP